MTHYELLVTRTNGHYEATVIGLPMAHSEAPTRQEAIDRARKTAVELLTAGEILKFDLNMPNHEKTLADLGGMWKNNELFDDFMDAINSNRHEVDEINR